MLATEDFVGRTFSETTTHPQATLLAKFHDDRRNHPYSVLKLKNSPAQPTQGVMSWCFFLSLDIQAAGEGGGCNF